MQPDNNYHQINSYIMSDLTSVPFADFAIANNLVAINPLIRMSSGKSLFVTTLTDKKDANGKAIALNIYFARTISDEGVLAVGDMFTKAMREGAVVYNTTNEQKEQRYKIGFPGVRGTSAYEAI